MLFNSIEFLLFFPIVFVLYWKFFNSNLRHQNFFLLVVSYFFYACWDWKFLGLIFISSLSDYFLGQKIYNTSNKKSKKAFLFLSLFINLGILCFFKYFNFFIESFGTLIENLGLQNNTRSLNLILPVGISFYTFQTLSYSIDIYFDKIKPSKNIIGFFAFVSFFPQLVAGPIERAKSFLPQFYECRKFDYVKSVDGLRQILWGLFKKIVIADTCAVQVDYVFGNYGILDGSELFLGAIFFAFQIYGDFSGYSDIAIGTARLLGFDLMKNFNFPYFSRDIGEFWQRWHISLSTWFRDYVYIPLGGNRVGQIKRLRNIVVTFTLSGFWHGANWTFVFWGFLNGLYYIPVMLNRNRPKYNNVVAYRTLLPSLSELVKIISTFLIVIFAWIFFRSDSIFSGFQYIGCLFSVSFFTIPNYNLLFILLPTFIYWEWISRKKDHGLQVDDLVLPIRWTLYLVLTVLILTFFYGEKSFIYFQF